MDLNIFQYSFMVRGLEAGIIVALIAPAIGIFLVLRRYSLIADTLAHVSLAGIALGLLLGINPIYGAIGVTALSTVGIERLRSTNKVYGESSLALFLSGSLAFAVILLSLANGFNTGLFSYLFGSIVTVTQNDVYTILILSGIVAAVLAFFYKELIYISFDEEAARAGGIPTRTINFVLILLTALVVSLSIPIVGVLLISALMVIPVVSALQFKRGFATTVLYAEIISIFSVIFGIIASFYLNLSTGGTIVLIMLAIFSLILLVAPGTKKGV
ncbi:MAG: metal ABC transporter permease [Candidatus Paceibacterota bacterium]|jgi:zinc transport system permease protein|nr:metal ABC transporter permease [Candidatus Paceibacterota bacterium]